MRTLIEKLTEVKGVDRRRKLPRITPYMAKDFTKPNEEFNYIVYPQLQLPKMEQTLHLQPVEFSPAAIKLLEALHCPTTYDLRDTHTDITVLFSLRDVEATDPHITELARNFLDNDDKQAGEELGNIMQHAPDATTRQQAEKIFLQEWLDRFLQIANELEGIGKRLEDSSNEDLDEETTKLLEIIGTKFPLIDKLFSRKLDTFLKKSEVISRLVHLIVHDLRGKYVTSLGGKIHRAARTHTTAPLKAFFKQLKASKNTLETCQTLIGTRNERRPLETTDINEIAEATASRYGYTVEITNNPTPQEGVIKICIDPEAIQALGETDITTIQYILQQTLKNTCRLQYIKEKYEPSNKAKIISGEIKDWSESSPEFAKTSIVITLGLIEDGQRAKLEIADAAVSFDHSKLLEVLAEEIRSFKIQERCPRELTPVERMIVDAEGTNHVPPITLQNQLMARGKTLTEQTGGTGLGLSSASTMAIFNGGYLTVGRNNTTQGAIMSISFPLPRTNIDGETERTSRIEDFNRMAERIMHMSETGETLEAYPDTSPSAILYDEDGDKLIMLHPSQGHIKAHQAITHSQAIAAA